MLYRYCTRRSRKSATLCGFDGTLSLYIYSFYGEEGSEGSFGLRHHHHVCMQESTIIFHGYTYYTQQLTFARETMILLSDDVRGYVVIRTYPMCDSPPPGLDGATNSKDQTVSFFFCVRQMKNQKRNEHEFDDDDDG